jgi:hypothetical protein
MRPEANPIAGTMVFPSDAIPADVSRPRGDAPMTVIGSNAIWLEGHAAQTAGQPASANPYPAGSQHSADWLEGYTAAETEAGTDRPAADG